MSAAVTIRSALPTDHDQALHLLTQAGLPVAGLESGASGPSAPRLWVAEVEGRVAGVAGLEVYGPSALLRSVAVDPAARGLGVGQRLVEHILGQAICECIQDVYLRTTTAEGFFPRFGFSPVLVEAVPAEVQQSVEFRGACPDSATTMRCHLEAPAAP